jgi:hypothetical protein
MQVQNVPIEYVPVWFIRTKDSWCREHTLHLISVQKILKYWYAQQKVKHALTQHADHMGSDVVCRSLYIGQFWIWRWKHVSPVSRDRSLNIENCCSMWRMYWWLDILSVLYLDIRLNANPVWKSLNECECVAEPLLFRMQCKGVIGPMTRLHFLCLQSHWGIISGK